MDGRRALVYSRIRENRLDPADNDITRGERQQQVTQAIADKLAGAGTFLHMPFNGDKPSRAGQTFQPASSSNSAG